MPQSDCLIYVMKGAQHFHGFHLKFLRIQPFQLRLRQDFPAEGSGDFLFFYLKHQWRFIWAVSLLSPGIMPASFIFREIPSIIRLCENSGTVMSIFLRRKPGKTVRLPCNEILPQWLPGDRSLYPEAAAWISEQRSFSRDYEYALLCQLMITASRELRSTDTSKSSDSGSAACSKNPSGNAYKLRKAMDNRKALRHG